jgi:rod shape-determining protein MreC
VSPRGGAWRTVGLVIAVLALLAAIVYTRRPHHTTLRIAVATQEVLGTAGGLLHQGTAIVVQGTSFMVGMIQAEREVQRLRQALAQDQLTILRERAAALEDTRLRSLLHLKQDLSLPTLPAEVVGQSPATWWEDLTINRGSDDGVRPNAPVLAPTGVIGRVLTVAPHSATVLLLADSQSGVGAEDARTGAIGVVLGTGAPNGLMFELLSSGAKLAAGDPVVTSGIGGTFAAGLPIGTVGRVTHSPSGLVTAKVRPAVDVSSVTLVLVVRGAS